MAERLCGLANAQGGYIIIGVADESLEIVGVPERKIALTKDVILRAARQIIKPVLLLDPPEPEVYALDGKTLVVATVPPNNGAVYQASGGVLDTAWYSYRAIKSFGDRGAFLWSGACELGVAACP